MYIRTKDGAIYDLKSKEISSIEQKDCWVNIFYYDREKGQYLEWDDNGGRSMDTIYKTEILNQSENLDELCDEFVMADNSNNKPYRPFIIYGKSLEELNERQSCNESLYGCIWTSKGLIYVAKMNDKGELELI